VDRQQVPFGGVFFDIEPFRQNELAMETSSIFSTPLISVSGIESKTVSSPIRVKKIASLLQTTRRVCQSLDANGRGYHARTVTEIEGMAMKDMWQKKPQKTD
jgi:hypothetical protein